MRRARERATVIAMVDVRRAPGLTLVHVGALLLWPFLAWGSQAAIHVPRLEGPPPFEEFLELGPDETWPGRMARVTTFVQLEPDEGRDASERTVAWFGYTTSHLYVVVVAFDRDPGALRARLAARDQIYDDDRVFVWLDTMADQRHAVALGVNPLNVQGDFAFTDPDAYDIAFDLVYESRAAMTRHGYVAWFAIPFRSLRFPDTPDQRWRVMVERTIAHKGEGVFWPGLSSRVEGRARQFAALTGVRDVVPSGTLQFVPYAAASSTTHPASPRHDQARLGLDAKAVLRQSLVLDATIRPDFSQIESDDPQLLANERFEVAVTERRPFFLENATLLRNTAGAEQMQLFFSRRIVAPHAGVRLSGRLGPWVLGSLVALDRRGSGATDGHAAAMVGVLRRDLPGRSDIGLIASSRRDGGGSNHVAALEGRFAITRSWSMSALLAGSTSNQDGGAASTGGAAAIEATHEGSRLRSRTRFVDVGPAFRADLGFVPRTDIRMIDQSARWFWRPGGVIVSHGPTARAGSIWDSGGTLLDWTTEAGYEVTFTGPTTVAFTRREERETFLGRPFRKGTYELRLSSFRLGWLTGETTVVWGDDVNHAPAAGALPATGTTAGVTLTAAFRPSRGIRIDQSVMLERLRDRTDSSRSLHAGAWRSTVSWQLTPGWSLRAIVERHTTDAHPQWSSARRQRRRTTDLLLAYRLRPGTALYVGYANATDVEAPPGSALPAPPSSRQHRLFVKASYLVWR